MGETLHVGESASKEVNSRLEQKALPAACWSHEDLPNPLEGKDLPKLSGTGNEHPRYRNRHDLPGPYDGLLTHTMLGKQIMEVILDPRKGVSKEAATTGY